MGPLSWTLRDIEATDEPPDVSMPRGSAGMGAMELTAHTAAPPSPRSEMDAQLGGGQFVSLFHLGDGCRDKARPLLSLFSKACDSFSKPLQQQTVVSGFANTSPSSPQ